MFRSFMLFAVLASLFLCSCARQKLDIETELPPTVFSRQHAGFTGNQIRRVVLLSPDITNQPTAALSQQAQQAIAEALREHDIYEVIEVANSPSPAKCSAWIRAGEYPVSLLCEMKARYNADAVMFMEMSRVRAVAPVSADVSVRLVDTNEGVTICSVDGQWSMSNPQTLERVLNDSGNSFAGVDPSLVSQSPRALFGIVGKDIAMELAGQQQGLPCINAVPAMR